MQAKEEVTLKFVEELKHQWMMTVDSLIDPLMIVGVDYKIKKANKALLKLAAPSEDFNNIIGRICYETFAKSSSPCPGCPLKEAVSSKQHQERILHQVNEGRTYEVHSQPILDSSGQLQGVVQTYHDRTEKERMQRQLMQAEKLAGIGLLAGGIAHEINNPLAGILVFAQMLLKDLPKGSQYYDDVKEIELAGKRCKEIIDNLLAFARQGPQESSETESTGVINSVELLDAVRDALRFAKMGLRNLHSIAIVDEMGSEAHRIRGTRNNVIHIFLNLIQNALQAMADGGSLTLRTQVDQENAWIVVSVIDTGPGIPPKNLEKIFDPFFTTKEPGHGTGLGLAICYGLVRDMRGTIHVASVLGEGTEFSVRLPLILSR